MVSQSELNNVPPWLPEYFIGGHPAFDFINTVSHRADPSQAVDRFDSLEKIADWCAYSGLLTTAGARALIGDAKFQRQEKLVTGRLAALRSSAGGLFDAIAESADIPSQDLARCLIAAGAAAGLFSVDTTGKGPKIHPPDRLISPDHLVALLAFQVLDAFYRLDHGRIKACCGCLWLFHDSSRGGRRRWCSMKDCGNREKVRRHYRRHKTTSPALTKAQRSG